MKCRTQVIVATLIGVSCIGCSSLDVRDQHLVSGPYPGVRHWPTFVKQRFEPSESPIDFKFGPIELPFLLADLPLSAGLDTMLLPADIIDPIKRHHEEVKTGK